MNEAIEKVANVRRGMALYFLVLVFLVATLNQTDRLLIAITAQAIKAEFGLSDTLLGFLGGTSFALAFSLIGLPLARYADRGNRSRLLAICLAAWSLMTALCGATLSFAQLLIARAGVAAGEAGFVPASHSLMTDFTTRRSRAAGFSVIAVGASAGAFLANALGGYLTTHYGWRMAFIALGLPGGALAALIALSLREPPRSGALATAAPAAPASSAALLRLLGNRVYMFSVFGSGLHLILVYGMAFWTAPFFIRTFSMTAAQAGGILGLVGAVAGIAGSVFGGFAGDWLARRDARWLAWWPALSVIAATPFSYAGFLSPVMSTAVVLLAVAVLCNAMYQASTYTLVQTQVAPDQRATAAALMILVHSLLSLAIGPLLIGALSDRLGGVTHGSLGPLMAAVSLINIPAALLLYASGREMRAALR